MEAEKVRQNMLTNGCEHTHLHNIWIHNSQNAKSHANQRKNNLHAPSVAINKTLLHCASVQYRTDHKLKK